MHEKTVLDHLHLSLLRNSEDFYDLTFCKVHRNKSCPAFGLRGCRGCFSHLRLEVRNMLYTGCPNKFGIGSNMFASKASIVYKKKFVFCSKKLLFKAFFYELQKCYWLFKAIFLHLLNKLLHKTNCSKKPFSFLQFSKKGLKSNFLEQNTFF